jgi:hypothetical protein
MAHVVLAGRYVRGELHPSHGGELLTCELSDWDGAGLEAGAVVLLESPQPIRRRVVRSVIRFPGGEPVAWVWLAAG